MLLGKAVFSNRPKAPSAPRSNLKHRIPNDAALLTPTGRSIKVDRYDDKVPEFNVLSGNSAMPSCVFPVLLREVLPTKPATSGVKFIGTGRLPCRPPKPQQLFNDIRVVPISSTVSFDIRINTVKPLAQDRCINFMNSPPQIRCQNHKSISNNVLNV
jgi:hypothetical protein